MSSNLYPSLSDDLKRKSIGGRYNDSYQHAKKESDEEIDEETPILRDKGKNMRSRSKSRERRSWYGADAGLDDAPATGYNLRSRHQEYRSHNDSESADEQPPRPQRHSTPTTASYGGDDFWQWLDAWKIPIVIIIVLVFLAVVVFLIPRFSNAPKPAARIPMSDIFVNELRPLETQSFNAQHSRLWSTVKASVKSVFNRFDKHGKMKADNSVGERSPAVVLFLSDGEDTKNRRTTSCLVKKLANITASVFANGRNYKRNFLDIDGSEITSDAKKTLERKLDGYLGDRKSNPVVVLRNIHRLSSEAALILHAYCDNENAPYRESVFYLTIECGDDTPPTPESDDESVTPAERLDKTDPRNWDTLAENCLRTQWLENGILNIDKIAPVLSRIANNVVFVFSESTTPC